MGSSSVLVIILAIIWWGSPRRWDFPAMSIGSRDGNWSHFGAVVHLETPWKRWWKPPWRSSRPASGGEEPKSQWHKETSLASKGPGDSSKKQSCEWWSLLEPRESKWYGCRRCWHTNDVAMIADLHIFATPYVVMVMEQIQFTVWLLSRSHVVPAPATAAPCQFFLAYHFCSQSSSESPFDILW